MGWPSAARWGVVAIGLLGALGAVAGGCSSSSSTTGPGTTSVSASSYDQSCASVADCVPITEGQVCGPGCGLICENAAINKAAQAQYDSDVKQITQSCITPPGACGIACVGPDVLTCTGGRCGLCVGTACEDAGAGDAGRDAPAD